MSLGSYRGAGGTGIDRYKLTVTERTSSLFLVIPCRYEKNVRVSASDQRNVARKSFQ